MACNCLACFGGQAVCDKIKIHRKYGDGWKASWSMYHRGWGKPNYPVPAIRRTVEYIADEFLYVLEQTRDGTQAVKAWRAWPNNLR